MTLKRCFYGGNANEEGALLDSKVLRSPMGHLGASLLCHQLAKEQG